MTDPIVVSYSELDTFRQCPLKHHLGYKLRYRKPNVEGSALSRGSLWHEVLEIHYRELAARQSTRALSRAKKQVARHLTDPVTGERTEQQELIWWMYLGHVEAYGADEQWEILEVEYPFEVGLVEAEGDKPEIRFKGKMDLLVRDRATGKVWIVDHKSGAELPSAKVIDIDDQFGLYLAATRTLGIAATGTIHSAARTRQLVGDKTGDKPTPLDKRFLRTISMRTDVELDNILMDARRAAIAAYSQTDAPYSSPNPDQCRWRCDFLEAHMLMRKGVKPTVALSSFGFEQDYTRH